MEISMKSFCRSFTNRLQSETVKQEILKPRESKARTSVSLRDNPTVGSLERKLSQLKLAYNVLTPVVDDIITSATSYTHEEFVDLLQSKSPICSISYNQYIKAFQASKIYTQIGKELRKSRHDKAPEVKIKNMESVNKDDLLQNITKLADRIFIDKDLMRQLVDLHEMIRDTIRKLRKTLDAEFEGLNLMSSEDMGEYHDSVTSIDKMMLRSQIAENFIVIGEPKKGDDCCYFKYAESTTPMPNSDAATKSDEASDSPSPVSSVDLKEKDDVPETVTPEKSISKASKPENDKNILKELKEEYGKVSRIARRDLVELITNSKADYTVNAASRYDIDYTENVKQVRAVIPTPSDLVVEETEPDESSQIMFETNLEPAECSENCARDGADCDVTVKQLKKMFGEVGVVIEDINNGVGFVEGETQASERVEGMFADLAEAERTQKQIVECLRELQKIKDLVKNINNSELIVEKLGKDCCDRKYLHLHARINGMNFVMQITKSTLNFLMGQEADKVEKSCLCKPNDWRSCPIMKNLKRPFANGIKSVRMPQQQAPKISETSSDLTEELLFQLIDIEPKVFNWSGSDLSNADDEITERTIERAFQERQPEVVEVMELHDSRPSLPYMVHRRSLPNIQTCESKTLTLEEMRELMGSTTLEHPRDGIQQQLQHMGVGMLLKASRPAKCCRNAVINERDVNERPFHVSLSSLPLTPSDLQLIADIAERECMLLSKDLFFCKSRFEYYTNFQENFQSNLEYFIERQRVVQVWYFEIFKSNASIQDERTSRQNQQHRHRRHHHHHQHHNHHHRHQQSHHNEQQYQRSSHTAKESNELCKINDDIENKSKGSKSFISELFRKLMFTNTTDSDEQTTEVVKHQQKHRSYKREPTMKKEHTKKKNRRSQTSSENLKDQYKNEVVENSEQWFKGKEFKEINDGSHNKRRLLNSGDVSNINDASSLSPNNFEETVTAIHHLEAFNNFRSQSPKRDCKKFTVKDKLSPLSNNNLGTIYETDEKTPVKDQDYRRGKNYESFYEFLRSPDISASFQKFITSESCMDAFQQNKIDPEQFWSLYFDARKSHRQLKAASKTFSATSTDTTIKTSNFLIPSESQFRKLKDRERRSKIPRRITSSPSASSSEASSPASSTEKLGIRPLHRLRDEANEEKRQKMQMRDINRIPSAAKTMKNNNSAKIYFTEMFDDSIVKSQQTTELNSLQSLQVLASKNGPGYITVLHPICGCPEVSIFIPCYCEDEGYPKRNPLTAKRISKLMGDKDGRHIVLPTSCRVPKVGLSNKRQSDVLEKT